MTNSGRGSSLLQARRPHHQHLHHYHLHNRHMPAPEAGERKMPAVEVRQEPAPNVVDAVVTQVVSVIVSVDAAGVPLDIQTIGGPPPVTELPPAPLDGTLGLDPTTPLLDLLPESSIVPPLPTDGILPTLPLPLSSSQASLTSAPSTSSSAFPTLAAPFNSSNPFFNQSLFSNSSSLRPFALTSTTSLSGFLNSTAFSKVSVSETSTTILVAATDGPAGAGVGAGTGEEPAPTESSTPVGGSGGSTPPQPGAIAGGVIGATAAAAIILFLVLFALKLRRKGVTLTGDTRSRGLLTNGSGSGPDSSGQDEERRGLTHRSTIMSVPSVLTSLSGYKRFSDRTDTTLIGAAGAGGNNRASTSEKGFYKVSGRKLPPVLTSGGDGYTDPRESVASNGDTSIYFRDSHAFFDPAQLRQLDSTDGPPRLALGSPMRPVSGVPIMRTGPARTPVTEAGPFSFSAPPTPSTLVGPPSPGMSEVPSVPPMRPGLDPLGRSLTSREGSGSRFSESMM